MQLSKSLRSKVVLYNISNGPKIFDLHHNKDQNQDQITVIINDNYVPLYLRDDHIKINNNDCDWNDDACHISIKDLRKNDKKILSLLNEEMDSTYSFKALERKLNIHQQSLTRALKRLRELELIERTYTGYRPIKSKSTFLPDTIRENSQMDEEAEPELSDITKKSRKRFNQLIQISIPIRNNLEQIINQLAGKWFGNLRWFGLIKKETGITLQWIAIDRYSKNNLFQINVNIVSEYVVIECNAVSDKEKIEAMSSSNRIVGEIIKTVQSNLQEECEIPDKFAMPKGYVPNYTDKVKYNYKKNK